MVFTRSEYTLHAAARERVTSIEVSGVLPADLDQLSLTPLKWLRQLAHLLIESDLPRDPWISDSEVCGNDRL